MIRGLARTTLGLVAATLLGACDNSAEVRYRVTVEVEDHGQVRTGSSVWSWTLFKPTAALGTPYSGVFRGEAVAVELSNGKTLYALLKSTGLPIELYPERLFADGRPMLGEHRVEDVRAIARRVGEVREVPRWVKPPKDGEEGFSGYPLLVTFGDEGKPETVTRVDPENLSETLGPSVSLKSVKVEITDHEVTRGIATRLRWLDSYYDKMLDGKKISVLGAGFANGISTADFRSVR